MSFGVGWTAVHGERAIERPAVAGIFEAHDRGEGEAAAAFRPEIVRSPAWAERAGPDQALALGHVEHASIACRFEPVGPGHLVVETAAGTKVELDLGRLIGAGRPPFLDMLGRRQRQPDNMARRIQRPLEDKISLIHFSLSIVLSVSR